MIFVTVGAQMSFDRLVGWMDDWAERRDRGPVQHREGVAVRTLGVPVLELGRGRQHDVGVVGGIGGTAIGLVLGELISAVGIPMPPPPGMTTGYLGEIQISTELSIDALSLAIVTTLAASIFPAWKASRMNVVDALRHQR